MELDLNALEQKKQVYQEQSIASLLNADNININAGNTAGIEGSKLNATGDININAKNTNIMASQDLGNSNSSKDHQSLIIAYDTAGGPSVTASADHSKFNSSQKNYHNSVLNANNININTNEDTNIKGATLKANGTLALNTNNLNVSSVQNTSTSNFHSIGASIGFSGYSLSSLGASTSQGNAYSQNTILTSLTGNTVNINTNKDTTLNGSLIAAGGPSVTASADHSKFNSSQKNYHYNL